MKLINMKLTNFQGLKDIEINANKNDVDVFGANGCGKTTIANAIAWLLTGKPSTDEKNYSPKSKDSDGNEIHGLNHVVEASFELDNGIVFSLKKDYHEESVGKRTRNSKNTIQKQTNTLESNVTDYYIDGKKVLQKEYNKYLQNLFTPEQSQMLTLPSFFSETMEWQDRLNILTSIAGEITADEVFDANPDLDTLKKELEANGQDILKFKAKIIESVKVNTKEAQTFQPRIDEAEKAKPDLTGKDKAVAEQNIVELKKQRDTLAIKKNSLTEDEAIRKNREALAKAETQKAEIEARLAIENLEKNKVVREEIKDLDKLSLAKTSQISDINKYILRLTEEKDTKIRLRDLVVKNIAEMSQKRAWAEEQYKGLKGRKFEPIALSPNAEICPCCGQKLPADKIAEIHEKHRLSEIQRKEQFERELKKELDNILSIGNANNKELIAATEEEKKDIDNQIVETTKKLDRENAKLDVAKKDLLDIEEKLSMAKSRIVAPIAFADTDEGKKLDDKISSLKKAILSGENLFDTAIKTLDDEIKVLDENIRLEESVVYSFTLFQQQENRISQLKEQERNLKDYLKRMDELLKLIEKFFKLRAEMLSSRINQHFKNVRFRLYENLINGGIKEICETEVKSSNGWINWNSASTSEKINGGLEVINELSQFFNIHLPIVIDNAETVSNIQRTDSQQIRLRVSESDKTLRILSGTQK